ncbi:MAG: STAS/SEC14 domain-containing protein [Victivallales bacterium]|nr:STAS/SEC14 domain-containing protein [Victivallales bacterium]
MELEYSVEVDRESATCLIRASGTLRRPADSFILIQAAAEVAKEHGCGRFLFDLRDTTVIGSTIGAYQAAAEPGKFGLSRGRRIAAVYSKVTAEDRFMEDVGVNRGATFRVFDDMDKARDWLAQ